MSKEDLKKQIELLVRDDESNQQTIIKQSEEIERLKNINEEHRILNGELRKELQQKENIIKEARNKIENTIINCDGVAEDLIDDILDILDKENIK